MSLSRREFLKSTTINTAALATIPAIVSACAGSGSEKAGILKTDDVLLFQGTRSRMPVEKNNGKTQTTGGHSERVMLFLLPVNY